MELRWKRGGTIPSSRIHASHRYLFFLSGFDLPQCARGILSILAHQRNHSIASFNSRATLCFPLFVKSFFQRHVHRLERTFVVFCLSDKIVPCPFVLYCKADENPVFRSHNCCSFYPFLFRTLLYPFFLYQSPILIA